MKTAIQDFISTCLEHHHQPERKGVPKGHSIGLTKTKLGAAMMSVLYSFEGAKIAETAGISYGLLRKWKTEEEFKKACKQTLVDVFDSAIWPAIIKLSNPIELNRQLSGRDFHPKQVHCTIETRLFADAQSYSQSLQEVICQQLPYKVKDLDPVLILPIYKLVNYLLVEWERPRGDLAEKEIKTMLNRGIMTAVTKTLQSCSVDEYEKRKAIWLMSVLEVE